jgi:hypothetical protein
MELASLSKFRKSFTLSHLFQYGNSKMADCPACGKPLKKNKGNSKHYCENSTCSVIFVLHPDKPPLMKVARKAEAR